MGARRDDFCEAQRGLPDGIRQSEKSYIDAWRRTQWPGGEREGKPLTALALSGGGIRSATFCLGVMQRLAEADVLRRFDYLSTVSGGGYLGAALVFHTRCQAPPGGWTAQTFPYGTGSANDTPAQRRLLTYLREHGQYLTPGDGMTLVAGIAALLRAVILNLVVWIPLTIVLMMVLALIPCDVGDALGARPLRLWLGEWLGACPLGEQGGAGFLLVLGVAGLYLAAALAWIVLYSLLSRLERRMKHPARLYAFRRWFERTAGTDLVIMVLFFAVGSVPYLHHALSDWARSVGIGAILAGIATGVGALLRPNDGGGSAAWLPRVAPVGALLLVYGIVLVAYAAATAILSTGHALWIGSITLVLPVVVGWFANVNLLGLHRYYRDRLMEALMPDRAADGVAGPLAVSANQYRLAGLARTSNADAPCHANANAPYHLINTNVVLVNSADPRVHLRGGDSFVLAADWCGGGRTGWRRTASFMEGAMTLPTAMAISGAAANPNTAVLRDPFVGLLTNLLNIRLGCWVPNPDPRIGRNKAPTHFHAAYYELQKMRGRGHQESRRMLQLSDGGHFDNLGIYELVRRRVEVIVVVDAVADPQYEFADLFRALRLIKEDFDVSPDFDVALELRGLMRDAALAAGYPAGRTLSRRCWFRGTLVGPDHYRAELFYITTTLTQSMPWRARGYWTANPDFPDQSTADQFFDLDQFEAYRELGDAAASEALAAHEVGTRLLAM